MRILNLVSHITIDGEKSFSRNKTGYGYMVKDIADAVTSRGILLDNLTQSCFTSKRKIGNLFFVKRKWTSILLNLKMYYISLGIKAIFNYEGSITKKMKILLYFFSGGHIERVIKSGNYDLAHIHGIGYSTIPYILACVRCRIPFLITLHGLNSLRKDTTLIGEKEKKIELDFIKLASEKKIHVTVISSGILKRIKNTEQFGIKDFNNISVVTNGTSIKTKMAINGKKIREKYNISDKDKIILCVGNICERKNQIQVVRAYNLLDENLKDKSTILMLGNDQLSEGSDLKREISKLKLQNKIKICGPIPKNDMPDYYNVADFNITASIDEGFGLPIIEGFTYGVPTASFSDIDAVSDLFNEECMVLANKRSDESLAYALKKMLTREFNEEFIKEYAKNFSLEQMANEYIDTYRRTKTSNISVKDISILL